jgi:hypothetical protein
MLEPIQDNDNYKPHAKAKKLCNILMPLLIAKIIVGSLPRFTNSDILLAPTVL